MKTLLKYLRDFKKECIIAPLFKMLEACFELFVPLVMAAIIDRGIAGSDRGLIFKYGGVLVLLAAVGLGCSFTAQYFAAKAAVGFSAQVKSVLFSHIQKLSFSQIDSMGTSTLITRLTADANQTQNGVNMFLRLFLRSPFIVFGAMIMAFTVNVKAALIFVVTIPLLAIAVVGITLITMPLYKKVQSYLDGILYKTRESLTGVRVIRAFGREEELKEEYDEQNTLLTNMSMVVGRISALTNPVTYIIVNVATIALLYSGAVYVDEGILTRGEVVALINYMSQILIELVKLTNLIILISKALASASRIETVLLTEPNMSWGDYELCDDKDTVAFAFDNVTLRYHEEAETALAGVSFAAAKGETIGVIGGTGSGKSSLVSLLMRFYDATEGSVSVFGRNVCEYSKESLRRTVSIVLQKAELFAGSIRDNMRLGMPDASDCVIEEALKAAQAYDFVMDKAGGLDYMIEQGGKNLSGGQRQRLTIARALVCSPRILILDDSASALDYLTDLKLRKSLKDSYKDMTVVIVSQRTSAISGADRIIVLDDGEVMGIGTHDELLRKCEVYKEIYASQYPDGEGGTK